MFEGRRLKPHEDCLVSAGRLPRDSERARATERRRVRRDAHRRTAASRARAGRARPLPHDARRRDRHALGHRRPDDRRVRALGLRAAHDRRRRRQRHSAPPRVELRRNLARPRRAAQHGRVPDQLGPRAQPLVVRSRRPHDRQVVHGRARHVGAHGHDRARRRLHQGAARTHRVADRRRRARRDARRSGRSRRCSATRRWA